MEVLWHETAGLVVGAAFGIASDEVDGAPDLQGTVEPGPLGLDDRRGGKGRSGDRRDGDAVDGGCAGLGGSAVGCLLSVEGKQAGCEERGELELFSRHWSLQTCGGCGERVPHPGPLADAAAGWVFNRGLAWFGPCHRHLN